MDGSKPWIYPGNLNHFIPVLVLAKLELILLLGADPVGNWLGIGHIPQCHEKHLWVEIHSSWKKRGVQNSCWDQHPFFSHPVQFPSFPNSWLRDFFLSKPPGLKINRIWKQEFAAGSIVPEAAATCLEFHDLFAPVLTGWFLIWKLKGLSSSRPDDKYF